ncbi:iron ABC transporter permease [cf. Phormidesmis sp. LEGE 11477]|uniref:FecCD family ABC transporter permease n=1 Tax=cf. Phormidesmis sp. LEGE 11477 TaxID=1828680 RepID=UPI0018810B49|nr:iron ABC transporter permease [cf. Phormidesmis sp. LEGE 11477]MBE9064124.1 iron ABC transporter permease [cf. Phormidesmis sp. LEGE 11477]
MINNSSSQAPKKTYPQADSSPRRKAAIEAATEPLFGLRLSGISGIIGLIVLLLIVFLASLALGSVSIPLSEVIAALLGRETTHAAWREIVVDFRLPRALTAMVAGAALANSGLQLQALFRNPLAGPSILGINAGASLGAALVVLSGGAIGSSAITSGRLSSWLAQLSLVGAASMGAAIAMLLVILVARQVRSSLALLIFGLMFGYTTTALVTILLHFSQIDQTLAYLSWTFGSFSGVTWQQLPVLLVVTILGLGLSFLFAKLLDVLLLGEEQAIGLGLSLNRVRCCLIVSASVLAGSVTAFCGPIAFLGVAVPHLTRTLLRTLSHRILIPATTLLGAILALVADAIAQLPGSQTLLPLNAVTALLGAPVLIWLMLKRYQLF